MIPKPIPSLSVEHPERMQRVLLALEGLSMGDAFGGQFFIPENRRLLFQRERQAPPAGWGYTDDTEMALGIYEILNEYGFIHQDELATVFARRYDANMYRGYGAGAHRLLSAIHKGRPWKQETYNAFSGQGSMGNGSAMRVAPVGAYFAEDWNQVVEQARLSAEVTHAHPEGIAGAIAIAVACAYAWTQRQQAAEESIRRELIDTVLTYTPAGATRRGVEHAATLEFDVSLDTAVQLLGNGSGITCPDTVPFCIWLAANHLNDFETALWRSARAGGDIDTTTAIIGGIVILATGLNSIPPTWFEAREQLQYRS